MTGHWDGMDPGVGDGGNQDPPLGFRIIFVAIPSATIRSESGMNGSLLQPGRDEEGLRTPGSHRVMGWAAISFFSRAASSSRVSPINTRLPVFRMRLGFMLLAKLIKYLRLLKVGQHCMLRPISLHTSWSLRSHCISPYGRVVFEGLRTLYG